MKKTFIFILAIFGCVAVSAQEWDSVELLNGSVDFARSGETVKVIMDVSHAVDVEYDEDWNLTKVNGLLFQRESEESFNESFQMAQREMRILLSRGKKKLNCIQLPPKDEVDPVCRYEMKYDIDTLDTGSGAAAFWAAGGTKNTMKNGGMIAVGTLTVTDLQSGEVVCKMKLNRTKGVIMAGMALRGALYVRISGLLCNVMIYEHMLNCKPNTLKPKKK